MVDCCKKTTRTLSGLPVIKATKVTARITTKNSHTHLELLEKYMAILSERLYVILLLHNMVSYSLSHMTTDKTGDLTRKYSFDAKQVPQPNDLHLQPKKVPHKLNIPENQTGEQKAYGNNVTAQSHNKEKNPDNLYSYKLTCQNILKTEQHKHVISQIRMSKYHKACVGKS